MYANLNIHVQALTDIFHHFIYAGYVRKRILYNDFNVFNIYKVINLAKWFASI